MQLQIVSLHHITQDARVVSFYLLARGSTGGLGAMAMGMGWLHCMGTAPTALHGACCGKYIPLLAVSPLLGVDGVLKEVNGF